MKFTRYIFVCLFWLQLSYAQEYIYQQFDVDEGLPSSEVYDMYQDRLGYIWFATDKGLSRYNGYEFENFTTKDGLPGNTILDFYPQDNGQIFCYEYHSQSLFYFNTVFDGFKDYKYNHLLKEQLNSQTVIKSVSVNANGTLYVGGYYLPGFIEITKEGILNKEFDKNTIFNNPNEVRSFKMGFQPENKVFFSVYHNYKSRENIRIFDLDNGINSRTDFKILNDEYALFIGKKLGIINTDNSIQYVKTKQYPICIKPINNNLFFVGYYSLGAEIRDVHGNIYERYLPNKSVSNFLIDSEGGYWISTLENGVFYIKNPKIKVFTEDHISSLVKDNNGNLFAGFNNGDIGKTSKDSISRLYKGLNNTAALVEFDADNNRIYGYGDGYLIDYTTNALSYYLSASKLPEQVTNPLLASMAHTFFVKDKDSLKSIPLTTKVQDVCMYDNTILVGTSSGLYAHKNDSTYKYQPSTLFKYRIDDLDVNKKTVYMATQGNGVVVFSDKNYSITKENGLTNNIVSEVHIENDSTIWACTNSGLNRIHFNADNTFNITTITKQDGLVSNDIDDVEVINDTVWVATKKGLCYFNENVLDEKEALNIQSLSLKEIIVNNERVYDKKIKLDYSQNNIDFKLQAISIKNTNNIDYYYRLKEADSVWTKTKSRTISFPSLSPGNYTFEAKAKVFNNPNTLLTSYTFKILPPFWNSWWFYAICLLLLFGLLYWFFKIRVLIYNQDIIRELIRLAVKRLKRKELFYKFRSNGEDFKIPTHSILYVNAQGNYLDIVTTNKTHTIRCKIGSFIATTPDALEYLRVHRSYIIRIDKVSSKGKNFVVIKDEKIPVGETYLGEMDKIQF
ncbi:ligand-binding sensor domain-containing protein [Mangrovimonas spongiae]|uniref:HTH LytTR-type domain-containing protein n=1 Tax=Mangrovimonas spongiae TaxID=2494697 RepID=A0A428K007_9FLAO|nr:two-component regulator propeller domain-containing protein [Mangrovimonas spongiae]RSK39664.1 hypothetical protein EJA19_07185 [Mangrovimonas spongiae]